MAKTDQHTIRVDGPTWTVFGALAGQRNRATVICRFIDWYTGVPGATLPQRPPAAASRSSAA